MPQRLTGFRTILTAFHHFQPADARAILETELKKAQERHSDLLKEWNNGDPEKMGAEHRNHQKYIDRVAELKASISRTESDINGLKRELGRAAK